ncbi:MAG: PepSY domain-containing protein [Candidatus Dormibacteria bacterium]
MAKQHLITHRARGVLALALVSLLTVVAITACGTAAAVDVNTATMPLCPSPGTPVPSPQSCLTPSEVKAGLSLVTMKTIPTAILLGSNINLTTALTSSGVSKEAAIAAANKYARVFNPDLVSDEAVYGAMHNVYGMPLSGQDVWVVNVSPLSITTPNANPTGEYVYVTINATTGQPIDEFMDVLHPSKPPVGPK